MRRKLNVTFSCVYSITMGLTQSGLAGCETEGGSDTLWWVISQSTDLQYSPPGGSKLKLTTPDLVHLWAWYISWHMKITWASDCVYIKFYSNMGPLICLYFCGCLLLQQQTHKARIFTTWPFTENIGWLLFYSIQPPTHLFIQQTLTQHLKCTKPWAKCWNRKLERT